MKHRLKPALRSAAIAILLAGPAFAAAQGYPVKPVTINNCYPAGGGVDRNLRAIEGPLGKILGQTILPQYRTGAGGTLAMSEMKSATPDGYTLTICDNGGGIIAPIAQGLDMSANDFVPIAQITNTPWILVAHRSQPYKSVQELVAAARAKPGTPKASIADIASSDHFTWLLFARAVKLPLTAFRYVPHGGGGPKMRAMLAGEAELDMLLAPLIIDHVKSGVIRPLGVTGTKRVAVFADVPTLRELGVDVVEGLSVVLYAPGKTPKAVVDTLRSAMDKVRADAQFQDVYGKMGQDLDSFVPGAAFEAPWRAYWDNARSTLKELTRK